MKRSTRLLAILTVGLLATGVAFGHAHGHHHHGGLRHVLHQLNLTGAQQTQVQSIMAQAKPQWQTLRATSEEHRAALAATAPTDPGYPALLATVKADAAARVQAESDVKSQVYAILTPAQQAQIPGIVAADQAARASRMSHWKAEHPAP